MTECERLIQEGIFQADFLREEVRCDFLVTPLRKKIWAIEIDALLHFDHVCKQYDLRYFLGFGALLGAVRHRGFIPWDDDIDVLMPREDYDRLFSLAAKFPAPYFLQTPYTDKGSVFSTIRLRNSNTTWMVKAFSAEHFNHGLGIDIFPLDYWKFTGLEAEENEMARIIWDNSTFMRRNQIDKTLETEQRVNEYLSRKGEKSALDDFNHLQAMARQFAGNPTNCLAVLCVTAYPYYRQKFFASDFLAFEMFDFEGSQFRVPIGYHRILTRTYGDYMQFPPPIQRGNWHTNILFDPDKPYSHYLNKAF
ncbi:MAG: LicD family protein [Kiritimatiellae bacterium]|nr:LicD family protein [Kiritimatiellia bacterium]